MRTVEQKISRAVDRAGLRLLHLLLYCSASLLFCSTTPGCKSDGKYNAYFPVHALYSAQYGEARAHVAANLSDDRRDRRYVLDRARLGMLTLADGYGPSAVNVFTDVYELIRTQGLNEGRQVVAVAINEDLKIWKGEPFEQALTLAYTGMAHAQTGSWDNARAAANNALFYLRDFGYDEKTRNRLNQLELTRAAAAHDRNPDAGIDLDHGYVVTESNFALGYLLHALASQQLDRPDEAGDYFRRAKELSPWATETIERFQSGDYNTVLIVSYGLGPQKVGVGPAESVAMFSPRTRSDDAALAVRVGGDGDGGSWQRTHWVTDVNDMADDHMWNNLEDVRKAKANVGETLMLAGAGAGLYGLSRGDEGSTRDASLAIAGGLLLAGAVLREGAHADLRFNDAVPQRYYAVPLTLETFNEPITLQIDGQPSSRVVLRGLGPPESAGGRASLRYVRLPARPGNIPLNWATSERVTVGNPVTGRASERPVPILFEDGNDARPPTDDALDDYVHDPRLADLTLAELRDLYRQRGITWTIEDTGGVAGRHVLEGGRSLVAPMGGTVGFSRLFCDPFRGDGVQVPRVPLVSEDQAAYPATLEPSPVGGLLP